MVEKICDIKTWLLSGGNRELIFQPTTYVGGIMKLGAEPIPVMLLRRLISRSTSAKWIKHQISRFGGDQNRTFRNNQFKFIDSRTNLKLPVAIGGSVSPNIRKIDSFGVHLVAMASIVANLFATMSASLYWKPEFIENTRSAACVVKKRIVRRIEFVTSRKRPLHCDGNPMAEVQALPHDWSKLHRQRWGSVKEECPSWLNNSRTLLDPLATPLQVFTLSYAVIVSVLVVLADVEGRICKNGVHNARLHSSQDLKTVCVEKRSVRGGKKGRVHKGSLLRAGAVSSLDFSWANVKEHATLSAGASVDHGV